MDRILEYSGEIVVVVHAHKAGYRSYGQICSGKQFLGLLYSHETNIVAQGKIDVLFDNVVQRAFRQPQRVGQRVSRKLFRQILMHIPVDSGELFIGVQTKILLDPDIACAGLHDFHPCMQFVLRYDFQMGIGRFQFRQALDAARSLFKTVPPFFLLVGGQELTNHEKADDGIVSQDG